MAMPTKAVEWFSWPRRQPDAALRLFCFPYAGGGAQTFFKWPDRLPPSVEVCPVNLPGRGRRIGEPAFSRMPDLVSACAPAVAALGSKPFALYGHSMGAIICFALARALNRNYGLSPRSLIVSGAFAPHLPDPKPLHHLPDPEFVTQLHALGGMPEEVRAHAELMELILPTLRADFTLTETYEYSDGAPLNCPITALYGDQDPVAEEAMVREWDRHTTVGCTFVKFSGDHFFIHSQEQRFLEEVSAALTNTVSALR